jgi:hypothetical protein
MNQRLSDVLTLVHAKRPLLEYVVTGVNVVTDLAESVSIWQDGQKLGKLDACHRRYSPKTGGNTMWYAITCGNIRKERGNKNTKFCKDAKTAARAVIELFTKKPLAELGKSLILDVKSAVESMYDRATYDYRNYMSGIPMLTLANYLTDIHTGKTVPLPKEISDHIVNREILRKRENHEIADNVMKHAKANNGYAIRMMQDETLLCAHVGNPDTTSKHQSTYELDQYTQEKFTMLKLLDPNQFAADIGIKYERDNGTTKETFYFIVAGETVTH